MLNVKSIIFAALFLSSNFSFAAGEVLSVITPINFGETVPKAGSCVLNPVNGNLTPKNLCVSAGVLGEYTITATANTTVRIKAISTSGHPQGFILEPTLRLTNNLGADSTNLSADTYIDFDTGSDGVITVYMGGTLTFPGGLAHGSSHSFNASLEYTEVP